MFKLCSIFDLQSVIVSLEDSELYMVMKAVQVTFSCYFKNSFLFIANIAVSLLAV